MARTLGLVFDVVPNVSVEDGIEAARSFIARCWFDRERCARGLDALASYHKAFDDKLKTWRTHPQHDWASHAADAFRYLAVGHRTAKAQTDEPAVEVTTYSPEAAQVEWLRV